MHHAGQKLNRNFTGRSIRAQIHARRLTLSDKKSALTKSFLKFHRKKPNRRSSGFFEGSLEVNQENAVSAGFSGTRNIKIRF